MHSSRSNRGQINLLGAFIALGVVLLVAAGALTAIAFTNHAARQTEPQGAAATALITIGTDLRAATMYGSTTLESSAPSGTQWTVSPPSPPPGTTAYLPSDLQPIVFTLASSRGSTITVTYTLTTPAKATQSGTATLQLASPAPPCNPNIPTADCVAN